MITPTRNLFEFAAYVSLFSQLVAGPIVRFRQIEKDLDHIDHADRSADSDIGWSFFVIGLAKKVLIADTIAVIIDPALAQLCRAVDAERLDVRARLHLSALLRLLRLQRHGGRPRVSLRPAHAAELQLTVPGDRHRGLLAPLAHLAVDVPARLPLHPAGRQSRLAAAHLSQPDDHDAARRVVARRRTGRSSCGAPITARCSA